MAQIKQDKLAASLITEGLKAVAEQTHTIIEVSDPEIAYQLQIEPRTLRGWKTPSGIPQSIDDEKLLGLIWLILAGSNKDLSWLIKLLKTTSIIVLDPPSPEWVHSCLRSARLHPDRAVRKELSSPSESEIERVIKRLFPASKLPNTRPILPGKSPAILPAKILARSEMPGEVLALNSAYYITRYSDSIALDTIKMQGVTLIIKAPRQMGKSSLLLRVCACASELGKEIALMDFQLFDQPTLATPEKFYRQFCNFLTRLVKLENQVEEFWNEPMTDVQRCTAYVAEYILPQLNAPLVLAMDEVDHIFDTELRSDFFAMLRHWHNSRQMKPLWQQLDLVLVTSTQPYQLIENLSQSPFNVGETIELEDFKPEQVADLNSRYANLLDSEGERRLIELLGGQPYLTQQAFYILGSKRYTLAQLFENAADERGPFGDHLRSLMQRLQRNPKLVEGMRQILNNRLCPDETVFWRLQGAGLVKRTGRLVVPRYKLYTDYFSNRLL